MTTTNPGHQSPLLRVKGLEVRYGRARALSEVSFDVQAGEVVAILGANGAGKSSLARVLSGLIKPFAGTIHFGGADLTGKSAQAIRRAGLVHLPEGRGVFPALSVLDNLRMAVAEVEGRMERREAIERACGIFPVLGKRRSQRAGLLSGGEQQMLSLARALVASPKLIIADEMSLGLAPQMVDLVFDSLTRARSEGVSVIMIEQFVHRALGFADAAVILQRGSQAWSGRPGDAGDAVLRHYLGGDTAVVG